MRARRCAFRAASRRVLPASNRSPCSGIGLRAARPPALLGLQDERAAPVEVDTPARGGAVRLAEGDGALEGVGVGRCVMRGLIGARNVQHVAKLGKEKRIIGALLPASPRPNARGNFEFGGGRDDLHS